MSSNWHETLKQWAKPPSESEEEKASNAARMISEAVRETGVLSSRAFNIYPTGSYRNNTNVRLGSDVDVALVLQDAFLYTLPDRVRAEDVGIPSVVSRYGLGEFRSDIGRALRQKFGTDVTPGNKTFDIAGNSYRLPADATPFVLHRYYTGKRFADGRWEYLEGVETRPANDPNRRIVNWHKEHYDSGVRRNAATNRRFKRVARILKRLRDDMKERGMPEARAACAPAASFLLECLAYIAPDTCFNREAGGYYEDVRAVISHAWNVTREDATASALLEVSGRKRLFGPEQGWTRAQAHEFLAQAWRRVGFPS